MSLHGISGAINAYTPGYKYIDGETSLTLGTNFDSWLSFSDINNNYLPTYGGEKYDFEVPMDTAQFGNLTSICRGDDGVLYVVDAQHTEDRNYPRPVVRAVIPPGVHSIPSNATFAATVTIAGRRHRGATDHETSNDSSPGNFN